ncbi:hypothetical protein EZ313_19640 [Ramlibacter henchirensis]|uniref:Uncharacterized protein n=1 Tax=Ramlibacter henchirensis TaxID=204072 RepID=A0A4Z0BMY3_9BURK|nr:hypothetical protein [Ramlibacter henchirensis]TFZ00666.1 hypothetical protein EZ313_19640 [Ramlibacter henchirensis]
MTVHLHEPGEVAVMTPADIKKLAAEVERMRKLSAQSSSRAGLADAFNRLAVACWAKRRASSKGPM